MLANTRSETPVFATLVHLIDMSKDAPRTRGFAAV